MKRFKITVEKTKATSQHRWAPDPHKRGGKMPSKKLYSRKGQPKAGPSNVWGLVQSVI